MSYLRIVGSFSIGLMVAGAVIVGPSNISAVRAEAPTQEAFQSYVVPSGIENIVLDRGSYSATTAAEVETIKNEREAAEKAAAEEAARKQAEADAAAANAKKKTQSTSSSGGYSAPPKVTPNPGSAQAIAHDMVMARGWSEDDFSCLVSLWNRESGWNVNAYNASSGATGIPQALPGSKMASAGSDWQTNPATQITWGLGYISGRYGTPCGAWNHSQNNGWY